MKYIFFIVVIGFQSILMGQQIQFKDTIPNKNSLKVESFILPSAFIITGIVGLESDGLKKLNDEISEEVTEHIDEQITIDDFSQYVPMIAVYGLNAFGVEGKHRFKERTLLLATSFLLTATTVVLIKENAHVLRPDGRGYRSFPSGHTATAFMGAEFLWQEYKEVNIWYGIAGYTVAAGTGIFRVYNNRHWLNDVIMGAGIGMFCTKLMYWLHPYTTEKIFTKPEKKTTTAAIAPFYNGGQMGVALFYQF
jgi:PAP2 superfamily